MKEYFIPGNTPSLKNSKVKTSKGIFHSKTVRKYLQDLGVKSYSASKKTVEDYKKRPNLFRITTHGMAEEISNLDYPVKVCFHFVRNSKRKFDFGNATEIIFDLMQAHGIIFDDDINHSIPFPMIKENKYYSIDKEKPGVFIRIGKNDISQDRISER